jgi:hypothetical protein
MAYQPTESRVIPQAIADTSTTQKLPLGTRVRAIDPTYGEGSFIYLQGVANTAVGSWVTYNRETGATALIAPNAIGPVAVAMSANVASQYGWYQTDGLGNASAADVADSGKVYIDTAAGRCDDAVVTGDRVQGAKWASADDTATGLALVQITSPSVNDQKDAT